MEPDIMNRRIALSSARVLITGGASGLGRQMAIQAAKRGARVVIWDRDADGAHRVRDEIHAADGAADAFVVDITNQFVVFSFILPYTIPILFYVWIIRICSTCLIKV
jgi:NAD(P)-dependent dehydrogenase (short-subunit alcohol dehydrogenase family)